MCPSVRRPINCSPKPDVFQTIHSKQVQCDIRPHQNNTSTILSWYTYTAEWNGFTSFDLCNKDQRDVCHDDI